jgi:glucose/arabinose dehydrogenase
VRTPDSQSVRDGRRTEIVSFEYGLFLPLPTGDYEDFMTGFVVDEQNVWARPVGVAVASDGALLVSEDGNNTIWRLERRGEEFTTS